MTFMKSQFNVAKNNDCILGRILMTDKDLNMNKSSQQGITSLMIFHEYIDCTPCGSISFEEERSWPTVVDSIDFTHTPQITKARGLLPCSWSDYNCTCISFDIKPFEVGKIIFQGGPSFTPHWRDLSKATDIYVGVSGSRHYTNSNVLLIVNVFNMAFIYLQHT